MGVRGAGRRRVLTVLVALVLSGTGAVLGSTAQATPTAGPPVTTAAAGTSTYVVETSSARAATRVAAQAERSGATVTRRYVKVLHGFAATMTAGQAKALRARRGVVTVAADRKIIANPCLFCLPDALTRENVGNWGLLRLSSRTPVSLEPDQPNGPLYVYDSDGEGVTAFVIDSGVDDGGPLAGRVERGHDFVSDDDDASDCSGHGSQVGEVIGGGQNGVANQVRVVPLRVFGCDNAGVWSNVIAALDWAVTHRPHGPAVVNISGAGHAFGLGDKAVRATIRAGLPVVVSAGNVHDDACDYSPARTHAAITVASSTITDQRSPGSDYGRCVDLFAAGQDVALSSGHVSGTSFAAAHVTGAVARYLENHRRANPAQVAAYLTDNATKGALGGVAGSPNRLLYLPPPVPPGQPRIVATSIDDEHNAVTVRWKKPATAGSAPVQRYYVCLFDRGVLTEHPAGQCVVRPADARTATLQDGQENIDIEDGGSYGLFVGANGKSGSTLSAEDPVAFRHALPKAPTVDVIPDQESGGMLVRIHPAADDYYAGPATAYEFTATNAANSADTQTRRIDTTNDFVEFFGLVPGQPYLFTGAVVTADGVGAASAPVQGTYPA